MTGLEPAAADFADCTGMVVRTARREDAAQLVALYESVAAEGPLTVVAPDEIKADCEAEAKRIADMAESEGSLCLVVEQGG